MSLKDESKEHDSLALVFKERISVNNMKCERLKKDFKDLLDLSKPKSIMILYDETKDTVDGLEALINADIPHKRVSYNKLSDRKLNKLDEGKYDLIVFLDGADHFEHDQYIRWIEAIKKKCNQYLCILEEIEQDDPDELILFPLDFYKEVYAFIDYEGERFKRLHIIRMKQQLPKLAIDQISAIEKCTQKLKIGYWIPHTRLTGTTKTVSQQIRMLLERGHEITLFRKGRKGEIVVPGWYELENKEGHLSELLLTDGDDIEKEVEARVDILVIVAAAAVEKFKNFKKTVVVWEHGFRQLFGEYVSVADFFFKIERYDRFYRFNAHFMSISPVIQEMLDYRYARSSQVLPNGIDTSAYYPMPAYRGNVSQMPIIIILGNEGTRYKRIDRAIRVMDRLQQDKVKFNAIWICQEKPEKLMRPYINVIVNPSQQKLQHYYRISDILIYTSDFESFALPPLEAMASGVSVAAIDNGGIMTYAKNRSNSLISPQNDEEQLYDNVVWLIRHYSKRINMENKAIKTAKNYDNELLAERAEDYYYSYWKFDQSKKKS